MLRGTAVLGVVPGAFDVIDRGADVHGGAMLRAGSSGQGAEVGEAAEGEIHFEGGALDAEFANAGGEIGGEVALADKREEGSLGVEVGGDHFGGDLLAAFQHHSGGAAVLDGDV